MDIWHTHHISGLHKTRGAELKPTTQYYTMASTFYSNIRILTPQSIKSDNPLHRTVGGIQRESHARFEAGIATFKEVTFCKVTKKFLTSHKDNNTNLKKVDPKSKHTISKDIVNIQHITTEGEIHLRRQGRTISVWCSKNGPQQNKWNGHTSRWQHPCLFWDTTMLWSTNEE